MSTSNGRDSHIGDALTSTLLGVGVGFNDTRVGASVVGAMVGLAVGFGETDATLGTSLGNTERYVLNM